MQHPILLKRGQHEPFRQTLLGHVQQRRLLCGNARGFCIVEVKPHGRAPSKNLPVLARSG